MRSVLRKFVKIFLLLSVFGIAAEISLRVAWPQVFPIYEQGMLTPDPVLGYTLTPNFVGNLQRADFRVGIRINGQGLRGTELRPRTDSTVRILCLGDSMTMGWGVEVEDAFPALLENRLQARYQNRDIQVINAGIPFFGTIDEVAFLRQRIDEFEPDVVVVQFNAVDDFEQNRAPAPERRVFEDGMLRAVPEFEWSRGPGWLTVLNRLKHRSHLLGLMSETTGQWLMRANMLSSLESVTSDFFSAGEAETANALLTQIAMLADQAEASTLLVYAPEKMQVLAQPGKELRAAQLVRETAESVGAAFVDITPASVAYSDIEALFSKAQGHWTVAGHQLITAQLFREIVDKRLVEQTR